MSIVELLIIYALTAAVFFTVDMLWLGVVAKSVYRRYLGKLMAPRVNWPAAIIFYLLFIVGVLIFAVIPAYNEDSLHYAVTYGALYGFFTYATYDLTNLATLKGWPLKLSIIDIMWGVVLSTTTAVGGFYITNFVG